MHFIKNLIHDQVIEVLFFPTEDQVANIFTKSLTEAKFSKLRSMLGFQEIVIKGGWALMPLSFSYCVTIVNPSILSQVVLKGYVRIFRHLGVSKIYLVYCVVR